MRLLAILLAFLFTLSVYGQRLTAKDMIAIMFCKDKACFDSLLLQKGYSISDNGHDGKKYTDITRTYYYERPYIAHPLLFLKDTFSDYLSLTINHKTEYTLKAYDLSKKEYKKLWKGLKPFNYEHSHSGTWNYNYYKSKTLPNLFLTTNGYNLGWHIEFFFYSMAFSTKAPPPPNSYE